MASKLNLDKLKKVDLRFVELEGMLADPEIMSHQQQYQKLAKEFSDITPLVEAYRLYSKILQQIHGLEQELKQTSDKEYKELAQEELVQLHSQLETVEADLEEQCNPQNKEKDRDLIFEIRAGTGGLEAGLFAADLYRMYTKYAAIKNWTIEPIALSETENGGIKEMIFSLSGAEASKRLKWESGVHRVQRVPETEASGRIHTSAATVAVMFEPEEMDMAIDPKDLKIDVYRASGPGGQSVNTTDSAIRITHLPTGLVVVCQDERSQLKNKAKAMRVLRARLQDRMEEEASSKQSQERKAMVGSGDRSEKIRTYNFPDRRITDHRIGFTTHQLQNCLNGDLDELTDALIRAEFEALKAKET